MRYSIAASALVLGATTVLAQGSAVEPSTSAGPNCQSTYPSTFEITIVPVSDTATVARRGLSSNNAVKHLGNMAKRQSSTSCSSSGTLVASLENGILTDSEGRTGSIVANRQFQFDPEGGQAGAIYTGGFAVCDNGNLSLGDQQIFYQCASGDFYNLYDEAIAEQCQPVYIEAIPCDGSSVTGSSGSSSTGSSGTQLADGQVNNGINQIADGQLQVPSIQQINDGQLQNSGSSTGSGSGSSTGSSTGSGSGSNSGSSTGSNSGSSTGSNSGSSTGSNSGSSTGSNSGSSTGSGSGSSTGSGSNANQISDGQIQNSGSASSSANQISDGQIQNSGSSVNQIADGQIQGRDVPTPMTGEQADKEAKAKRYENARTEEEGALFDNNANAAVPNKAKLALAGLVAAVAGFAALI